LSFYTELIIGEKIMNNTSITPSGVICDIWLWFQRDKNKCANSNHTGNKPYHCTVCSIKSCVEKNGNDEFFAMIGLNFLVGE